MVCRPTKHEETHVISIFRHRGQSLKLLNDVPAQFLVCVQARFLHAYYLMECSKQFEPDGSMAQPISTSFPTKFRRHLDGFRKRFLRMRNIKCP